MHCYIYIVFYEKFDHAAIAAARAREREREREKKEEATRANLQFMRGADVVFVVGEAAIFAGYARRPSSRMELSACCLVPRDFYFFSFSPSFPSLLLPRD